MRWVFDARHRVFPRCRAVLCVAADRVAGDGAAASTDDCGRAWVAVGRVVWVVAGVVNLSMRYSAIRTLEFGFFARTPLALRGNSSRYTLTPVSGVRLCFSPPRDLYQLMYWASFC